MMQEAGVGCSQHAIVFAIAKGDTPDAGQMAWTCGFGNHSIHGGVAKRAQ